MNDRVFLMEKCERAGLHQWITVKDMVISMEKGCFIKKISLLLFHEKKNCTLHFSTKKNISFRLFYQENPVLNTFLLKKICPSHFSVKN